MIDYNGCPYCKPNDEERIESLEGFSDGCSGTQIERLYIRQRESNKFYIHIVGRTMFEKGVIGLIPIWYCPVCGRKLT